MALVYLAAGFVVVELADIAGGTFDLPGWFGPMVWVLVGLGFPIALILAWALEMTPEGVRVDKPEGPEERASPGGFSPSNGVIAGLLIIAIGLLRRLSPARAKSGFDRSWRRPPDSASGSPG